jgi:hypothetical protein
VLFGEGGREEVDCVEFRGNIPGLDAPRENPAHTCPWVLF